MTTRLYYTDCYSTEFDATVLTVTPVDAYYEVVLDQTLFYPTSGGQPFDIGTLGDTRVIDVRDDDNGGVVHVVEKAIEVGPVHGSVDWSRRFEHMQQHTGQHVLSAAFDRLLQVRTVSFHLGSASSTIDLAREVTADEIARAELEANRIVWEDRPVTIRFANADEAAKMSLRKESKREGVLRIVEVDAFDVSACGGTHVSRTGAIGMIAASASEKFKGGTRVEFLCGGRALKGFHALSESVGGSVRLLSVLPAELPAAIERLQAEARDLKRHVKDAQAKLAVHEADALAGAAETIGATRAVIATLEGWDAVGLKTIAASIAARPGHLAVLLSLPAPAAIVVARATDVAADSAAILKQMTATFGGKGGGRPELAQGGGLSGDPQALLTAARAAIAS